MRKTTRLAALLLALALLACLLALPAGAAGNETPLEMTFEAAFKSWKGEWAGGGRSPIKMKLEGDALTFDYSPVFYIDGAFGLAPDEEAAIIADCVRGFQDWEGVYPLYGREITVRVNVHPETTNKKLSANVRIRPGKAFMRGGGMVLGCIIWRPCSPFLKMNFYTDRPQYRGFERLAMHEFGHVLGLFDAYGYDSLGGLDIRWLGKRFLPEAPPDRAPWYSIMNSGYQATSTEIAMLLYAWKNNRLQLYTKSVMTWLGAEVSPAFSQ